MIKRPIKKEIAVSSKTDIKENNTVQDMPKVSEDKISEENNILKKYKIGIYEDISLPKDEIKKIKSLSVKLYRHTMKDDEACYIVHVKNCYAVVIDDSESETYKLEWIMSGFKLIKKSVSSDNTIKIDIMIRDELGEKFQSVPMDYFTKSGLSNLAKYGIHVSSDYKETLEKYFLKQFEKMPLEDGTGKLGIVDNTGTKDLTFNAYTIIDGFEKKTLFDNWQGYLDKFNELLEESEVLQYMLSATMSAPVLTILNKKFNYDLHSYCINVVGSSSTGKTISSKVCASAWTNPNSNKIYSAMHATANASLKRLDGRYGIPTFFDEATTYSGNKAVEFAYSVYNETEKARMTSDCNMKKSGTWSTIVMMTSEEHFRQNKKNQNGGLDVRVLTVESDNFTASADHAEKLSRFIQKNYGMIGYEFVNYIIKNIDDIDTDYENAKYVMKSATSQNKGCYTDRLINIYALTYMTAEYLNKIGIEIDIDAVKNIMVENNKEIADNSNMAKNAFEAIISYIARNQGKFGYREISNENTKKYIIEEGFMNEILTAENFKDTKVTIKELDKAGYLIRQGKGKGLKSKLTVNGKLCSCYQIDLTKNYEDVDDSEETKKFKNINIKDLFGDNDDCVEYIDDDDSEC